MSMLRYPRLLTVWLAAGWLTMAGCEREATPPIEPAPEGVAEPQPEARAPEAPQEPPGPEVMTDSYRLAAETADTHAVGQLGQVTVEITGRGEWHVNEDFPTRVEVRGPPGVTLPKASLQKADAAEFGEQRARFEIPFTAEAAGAYVMTADVAFAICTDDTCVPQRKSLAVALQVE
jgi:hypothetical protein